MSEKQFDMMEDQFRNAAEQYQPEFDESSWQKMESKLDAGKTRPRPAGWLWWATDLVMISLIVFMMVRISPDDKKETSANSAQSPAVDQRQRAGENSRTQHFSAKEGSSTTKKQSGVNPLNHPDISFSEYKSPGYGTASTSGLTNSEGPSGRNPALATGQPSVAGTAVLKTVDGNLLSPATTSRFRPAGALISATTGQPHDLRSRQHPPLLMSSGKYTGVARQPEVILRSQNILDKKAEAAAASLAGKKRPITRRLYAFGVASPEWSFVPGRQMGTGALNYGGGIGYVLNKKWSLQAGVFSSKKIYTAGPKDYKPRPGTYYYNLTIYGVDAACDVLEIPLMVNYNVFSKGRHSIAIGAGFASLLMNREEYHYDYMRSGGTRAYAVYTYKTGKFYPFSAAMLAPSYKLKVNDMFSLVGSPYAKLPVYGVGEGKVKLASAGVMVGLQFQLPSGGKEQLP